MLRSVTSQCVLKNWSPFASVISRDKGTISKLNKSNNVPKDIYWQDKVNQGPAFFECNYGHKETLHQGTLPHMEDNMRVPVPTYKPKNPWAWKRQILGQNDYIDILGGGKIQPYEVTYNIPSWLRGFQGDEYQMLLRRRKAAGDTLQMLRPKKHDDMRKQIRFLYKNLNKRRKDVFWKKDRAVH